MEYYPADVLSIYKVAKNWKRWAIALIKKMWDIA